MTYDDISPMNPIVGLVINQLFFSQAFGATALLIISNQSPLMGCRSWNCSDLASRHGTDDLRNHPPNCTTFSGWWIVLSFYTGNSDRLAKTSFFSNHSNVSAGVESKGHDNRRDPTEGTWTPWTPQIHILVCRRKHTLGIDGIDVEGCPK